MPAAGERVIFASPFAAAGGRVIASPFQFLTDDDDNLRLVSVNSVAGVTLAIQGRRLDSAGEITPIAELHTPNTNRTTKTQNYKLGKGAILNLTVFASAGAPLMGQTYVIVQLIKGLTGATIVLGTLLGGYLTATQALGWPGSPIVSSTDGEGCTRAIVGTIPAAGVDILETVPAGARWELLSAHASLTLGAAATANTGAFTIDDGANVYARVISGNSGAATTVNPFCWSQAVPLQNIAIVGGVFNLLPLTANRLRAGHRFAMTNLNVAGQKTWSAPTYNVREWLEVG